jgi:hypothetical protein
MIITAKFASTCDKCSSKIRKGDKVEWRKGYGATHVSCAPQNHGIDVDRLYEDQAMAWAESQDRYAY